jgi:energy-coupling factor transporter ATP-binding protein EcfA2
MTEGQGRTAASVPAGPEPTGSGSAGSGPAVSPARGPAHAARPGRHASPEPPDSAPPEEAARPPAGEPPAAAASSADAAPRPAAGTPPGAGELPSAEDPPGPPQAANTPGAAAPPGAPAGAEDPPGAPWAASTPGATTPPEAGEPSAADPAVPQPVTAPTAPAEPAGPAAPTPPSAAAPRKPSGPVTPFRRVEARPLEAALLELRHAILEAEFFLEAPGVAEARAERRKLLSQIDDYLLPRLRQSGSPVLVALVGSTGAGKSTLVNSLVGKQVSNTGIRRPTTNSPVLASHPSEVDWFAENVFLPTLPRVRQQGLAMAGRDGLLVLASSDGMPQGVALLDTPDIDSVVQAHYEFAHQFLDASDLWLFMTTAARYADAAVWELLQYGRDRGASLGIVLSRVPPSATAQLTTHFDAMLAANGLGDVRRFVIPETVLVEGRLPAEAYGPIKEWLQDTATRDDRRVAVLTQTMSGVLDTFRTRIPDLAAALDAQQAVRRDLRAAVAGAYLGGQAEIEQATSDGSLFRGEILARWQDFAGTGDLLRMLQVRRGGQATARLPRKRRMPGRAAALDQALRAGLESLIVSVADRAAEVSVAAWREIPAGAALLGELTGAEAEDYSFGSDFAQAAGLDLDVMPVTGGSSSGRDAVERDGAVALARSGPEMSRRTARVVSSWQEHVLGLVRAQNVTKRSIARTVPLDEEPLALALTAGLLGYGAGVGADAVNDSSAAPDQLLTSLFGAEPLRELAAAARADLRERVSALFDEEMLRFEETADAAGVPADGTSRELTEAEQALEEAR